LVQPGSEAERRAVERFADQIRDELNIKEVTLHAGPLLTLDVRPNLKTVGPKLGPRLKEVQATLASTPAATLAEKVQAGQPFELPCPGGLVTLDPTDLWVTTKAPEGWAGVADCGTQVLISTCITEELAHEGMARDVIRQVQQLRKDADLETEDRIVLHLATESAKLRQAIAAHREYICAETLATEWAERALNGKSHQANVKVDGQALTIELSKVT
jgi:isoleucyl-tRNA synthetase